VVAADLSQPVGFYIDMLGGVALIALAGLVMLVKPRRALNVAFAGYAFAVGAGVAMTHVFLVLDNPRLAEWSFIIGIGLGGASLVLVGLLIDRTISRRRHRIWPFALAVAVPYVVDRVLVRILFDIRGPALDVARYEFQEFLVAMAFAGVFFLLLVAAVRTRQEAWTMPAPVAALLVVGLVALPAFDLSSSAAIVAGEGDWRSTFLLLLRLAMFFACGIAWLAAVPRRGRPALVAGLACFFFPALGVVTAMAPAGSALEEFLYDGSFGTVAVFGVACLAYAILRHQMFDVDVKLKLTLRRGTIVGVFLAAFFVVSQLIQVFTGQLFGLTGGAVVAGLLLFGLAPIQRAAERLSDKAMPNVKPQDAAYVLRKKRETYRNAVATAWADGTLTQKDMRMLQQVREALALPEKDVLAIEREWVKSAPKA
jgi:hypothetical protein